ncbi:MAG: adenylate kinase [Bacilli bacterium]
MKNIIFIAPPAAGKGTQSDMLKQEYGYNHISTGDILREAITSGSELGKNVKNIIDNGQLVTDEIMINLIQEKLEDIKGNPFILDGFPRTLNQAIALDKMLRKLKDKDYIAIYLELDESIALQRVLGRLTCKCGKSYNIYDKNLQPNVEGICDYCGEKLEKRKDDNEISFKTRFDTFLTATKPIVDYYKDMDKLHVVNVNQSVSEIFDDISKVID